MNTGEHCQESTWQMFSWIFSKQVDNDQEMRSSHSLGITQVYSIINLSVDIH